MNLHQPHYQQMNLSQNVYWFILYNNYLNGVLSWDIINKNVLINIVVLTIFIQMTESLIINS